MQSPRFSKSSVSVKLQRNRFDEEIRSRIQFKIDKLREAPTELSFYKLIIDTPEFSRFIFAVPGTALLGMTVLSLSPPTSLPLVFEKFIPYQIKTIGVSLAFHSFVDLAINVIGRPSIASHHRLNIYSGLLLAYASLMSAAAALAVSDADPRTGYKTCLALIALHAIPATRLAMAPWIRTWRIGFLALSTVSVFAAWRKLNYLETHWDTLVFSATTH